VNNREALNNALMRLFNTHLSSIRTKMSENVFARWKGKFPILRIFRAHYHHTKLIIMGTPILHNIAIKFGEVEPEDDESVLNLLRAVVLQMDEPDAEDERAAEAAVQQVRINVPAVVDPARRVLGQLRRNQMRDNMSRRGANRP
jgi:hypothetical protein